MDTKAILEGIKKLLFGNEAFTAYTLGDGSAIEISVLEVGGDVTKDGAPAADGDYELSDGSKITVAAGKITVVTPKEAEVVEMAVHKLQDGTEVEISTLAEGGNVVIAGVPATEGEYVLEDGTKITVDATGAIIAISVAGIDPNAPLQMSKQEFAAATIEVNAKFVAFEKALNAKDAKIADLETKLANQLKATQQLFSLVEQLGGAPAGDPPPTRKGVQSFGLTNEKRGSAIDRYAKAAEQALK